MLLSSIDLWDTHIREAAAALGWPLEGVLRLFLAALAGGLIGLEREIRGRQAGFRTNMLVCLGSALVMIVSIQFASHPWHAMPGMNITVDPARIAYGVMAGVGFLGAGAIIHGMGGIRGLTTAAGLWCVAALGLAIGFGHYVLGAAATVLIVLALWFLGYIEELLPREKHRCITLRTPYHPGCVAEIVDRVRKSGIKVDDVSFRRTGDLSQADITLEIMFVRREEYRALEQLIEGDKDCQFLSMEPM